MEILQELMDIFWFEALIKILLGAILTGLIGLERSSLNKPAGFGTHAILGVSAVLVVLCSEYLSTNNGIDMSRIPAQLLSGIGFIGAGTILRNGLNVKGVTTAAGLLAVTCIGLSVGAGFYFGAIVATIIVYLILVYSHNLSDKIERFALLNLEITIKENVSETLVELEKYFASKKIEIKGIKRPNKEDKIDSNETIEMVGKYDTRTNKKNKILSDLINLEHIIEVTDTEE